MLSEPDKRIRLSDIKRLDGFYHRGSGSLYRTVWVYTPFQDNDLHIGYLDNRFFAYTRPAYGRGIDIEKPESVIDYYLDSVFFQIEAVEKDMVMMNRIYRPYKIALDNFIRGFRQTIYPAPNKPNQYE